MSIADTDVATTSRLRNSLIFSESLVLYGAFSNLQGVQRYKLMGRSQIRQGIANNTKGTAFVVFEDVMDAKQACDKLNGFNFQSRYLVGEFEWRSIHIKTAH